MLKQIFISIGALKISKDFIVGHRLWERWESMRWLHTTFVILAIYFGFKMLGLVGTAFSNLTNLLSGDLDAVQLGFSGGVQLSDWSFANSGFQKYLFLFFTMSLVFHFGGRTVEVLYGIPYRPNFKSFYRSQVRSFIAVFVCYILEQVLTGVSAGLLSTFGAGFFKPIAKFLIQGFLFGMAIIDGLHDVRGSSIKQGLKHSFNFYPGIALTMGCIGLVFSYIPVVGIAFVSSILVVALLIAIKRAESLMA